MKYLTDNMFNGVAKALSDASVGCETVNHAIWGDNDPTKVGRHDAKIFRYLLEKKYRLVPTDVLGEELVVVTADKDLARYCQEFELACEYVHRDAAPTKSESMELAARLINSQTKSPS
jgi:hypothetical protein